MKDPRKKIVRKKKSQKDTGKDSEVKKKILHDYTLEELDELSESDPKECERLWEEAKLEAIKNKRKTIHDYTGEELDELEESDPVEHERLWSEAEIEAKEKSTNHSSKDSKETNKENTRDALLKRVKDGAKFEDFTAEEITELGWEEESKLWDQYLLDGINDPESHGKSI